MTEGETISLPTLGSKLTLNVTDLAFGGEGVGRVGDFVVFVPFVIPGEEVEVEVTELKKSYARARLLNIFKSAPERVSPRCPYFGSCGGCQYQHVDYGVQLRFKHRQVSELLARIGHIDRALIDPVAPCPAPYGYRNRIMVRSQWDKFEKRLKIGFLRHDNRLLVDIEQCPISEPAINEQLQHVRANPPPKGGLKVVLRVAPEGWEVPKDSFFQNNFHLLPKLVETVRNAIRVSGSRHLVDVYCGVGFFAMEAADLVESFAGIELDKMAVKSARRNMLFRQRTNGEFVFGSAEEKLPELLKRFPADKTTVVLDPPRAGCAPSLLQLLRDVRPAQVIYVSCHPATLARDLNVLTGGAVFEVTRVVPLDMFPQTQHVECVADVRLVQLPPPDRK